jgi:hypothetical protein
MSRSYTFSPPQAPCGLQWDCFSFQLGGVKQGYFCDGTRQNAVPGSSFSEGRKPEWRSGTFFLASIFHFPFSDRILDHCASRNVILFRKIALV